MPEYKRLNILTALTLAGALTALLTVTQTLPAKSAFTTILLSTFLIAFFKSKSTALTLITLCLSMAITPLAIRQLPTNHLNLKLAMSLGITIILSTAILLRYQRKSSIKNQSKIPPTK